MPTGVYPRSRPRVWIAYTCRTCGHTARRLRRQGVTQEFCSNACHQASRHVFPGSRAEIKDLLFRLYWAERLTTPAIAAAYGIDHGVVKQWMRRTGIPIRTVKASKVVTRVWCSMDGCARPVQVVRHKSNGSSYGTLCRAHRHEHRLNLSRRYRSSEYDKLTEEERWLRKARETLVVVKRLCRAPSS